MPTDPYIITDFDAFGVTACSTILRCKRMFRCIYSDIRADQAVVADLDTANVQYGAVIVSVEIVSDMNIHAEITMEIIANECPFSYTSKQIMQDLCFLFLFRQCK